ncbi:ABC transporter permease [Georgenia sp. EYE_87]|uniref:ABC transporter permease n=1 Tax=Georgenia sp. EYE_87 TaxID=2853448 RepID=UPI0020048194|nr:ABC transporter permease [Georgenia sp. EYE_87]MCK6211663.1 ABC transporter permease [Georgenia sp. EYE_87]
MDARLGSKLHIVSLLGLVVLLFVVLSILAPSSYPTVRNIVSMASQMAPIGILALCVALTFLIGGIDLSIVAVANAAAIAAARTIAALEPRTGVAPAVLVGVVAALAVGVLAGIINGTLISYLRVHPIPITLGTLGLFAGVSTGLTGGSTVYGTGSLRFLGRGTLAGIPVSFLIFALLVAALAFLTTRTRFGFRMYAIGASEKVSRFARMDVERAQVVTYIVSGLLASTAGLVMFAGTNAANVSFGSSFLIQAILVAVLSGVDTYGGRGRIALVILAVAAMQQVQTGINMALGRWSGANFAAEFGWGVLLIAVLGLSQRLGDGTRRPGWRFWSRDRGGAEPPGGGSGVRPEQSVDAV